MKKIGPYKASPHPNVQFFFIYHKPDRKEYVAKLYDYFLNGYKGFFPSLKNHIKQPFFMDDKNSSLGFESPATAIKELKIHLINLEKSHSFEWDFLFNNCSHSETETKSK